MSTIASPRPSIALSSRRGSASTDTPARSSSVPRPPGSTPSSVRRHRAALRDYYGLKDAAPADARDTLPTLTLDGERESELDKPNFSPESYVQTVLATEGLEGALRVEAGLVSDIRSLDSEKKALVYDNYSKLIAATDTIRSMREKMDPLTQTSSLMDDIGHIAETAATLSTELREHHIPATNGKGDQAEKKKEQQQTVRWVLGAPERLKRLVDTGRQEEAQIEWKKVSDYLDRWAGTDGVAQVRQVCLQVLDGHTVGD